MLPSYAVGTVTPLTSAEAEAAWTMFRDLWVHANPTSTSYNFMQNQLVSEAVWVAFDLVARIADAFNQKPDDSEAFPAPAGPKGRAYTQVIAGVAILSTAPDMEAAKALVAYMMQPETQAATLRATNFFPVVDVVLPDDMPASPKTSGPAIAAMSGAPDTLPLVAPGIAASAVFDFVISWSEVFAAAVLTIENRTLTAFLMQSLDYSPLHLKFAGVAAMALPALIIIFAVRKYLPAIRSISNRHGVSWPKSSSRAPRKALAALPRCIRWT